MEQNIDLYDQSSEELNQIRHRVFDKVNSDQDIDDFDDYNSIESVSFNIGVMTTKNKDSNKNVNKSKK